MNSSIPIKHENFIKRFLKLIDRFSWGFLLISTPLFMFISPKTSWVLLIIPLFFLVSFISGNQPVSYTPFNAALLLLTFQMLVSLYATYDIAVSLSKIAGLVFSISLFFFLINLNRNKKGMIVSIVVFLSAGLGISILGLMGTDWSTSKIMIFNPIYELIPSITKYLPGLLNGFHPNEVAGTLTWVIPVWLCVLVWLFIGYKKLKVQPWCIQIFLIRSYAFLIISIDLYRFLIHPITFCIYRHYVKFDPDAICCFAQKI